jgi:hypothetical protein
MLGDMDFEHVCWVLTMECHCGNGDDSKGGGRPAVERQKRRGASLRRSCSLIPLLSLGMLCFGQNPNIVYVNREIDPSGKYSISQIEAVNTVNGNTTLTIPVATLPNGRAGFPVNLSLVYKLSAYRRKSGLCLW